MKFRFANPRENRIAAVFAWAYPCRLSYSSGRLTQLGSSHRMPPHWWMRLETFMMRGGESGELDTSLGSIMFVKRKCATWLTPKLTSKPSPVRSKASGFWPAALLKRIYKYACWSVAYINNLQSDKDERESLRWIQVSAEQQNERNWGMNDQQSRCEY